MKEAEIFLAKNGILQKIRRDAKEFYFRIHTKDGSQMERGIRIEKSIWVSNQ